MYAWFCSNSFQAQQKLLKKFISDSYTIASNTKPTVTCQNSQRQSHEFDFADFALVSMQLCKMNY